MAPARSTVDVTEPIALDAMGGDVGVSVNVAGAVAACTEDGERIILVGDEATLRAELGRSPQAAQLVERGVLTLRHAPEVVAMDDKPVVAARKKKQSSMRIACDLVEEGQACGALSAGNSGAFMATALLAFGRIDGVSRPAIGTLLPSFSSAGFTILIDAGANVECAPEHLAEWGVLGAVFAEHILGIARPEVGIVSNGEEETKGTELTRAALALLKRTDVNVHGYIEGRDLNTGVPVIVTDGFTGNVMLKTAEGVFKFVGEHIKRGYAKGGPLVKLGGLLSQPMFAAMRKTLDPREFGAAPLFGLRRPAFVAHGSSDPYAIRRGIAALRTFAGHKLVEQMTAALARNAAALQSAPATDSAAAAATSTTQE